MMSGSGGSKASARPSVTALIMFTHRIWTGVIGSVVPARIASRMISACAVLVGSRNRIVFRRLS